MTYFQIFSKTEIRNTKFGFRNGADTREGLCGLNVLAQRYDKYLCFEVLQKNIWETSTQNTSGGSAK